MFASSPSLSNISDVSSLISLPFLPSADPSAHSLGSASLGAWPEPAERHEAAQSEPDPFMTEM